MTLMTLLTSTPRPNKTGLNYTHNCNAFCLFDDTGRDTLDLSRQTLGLTNSRILASSGLEKALIILAHLMHSSASDAGSGELKDMIGLSQEEGSQKSYCFTQ